MTAPRKTTVKKPERSGKEIMAELRAELDRQILAYAGEFSPDEMLKSIMAEVRGQKNAVIAKLLGFDSRYKDWEVDHCNGRISPVSMWLASCVEEEFKAFMVDITREVLTEGFRGELRKALVGAIKKELSPSSYKVQNAISDAATALVSEVTEKAKQDLRRDFGLIEGNEEE